ncbi:hypothetical protein FNF29_02951 [Cafeteria roenbergensis]|uniref:Uncharacterized protein n=1 Tax=Cafeteria roenbergensis TaxID=33653 RepID=A0A5A8CKF6_CAFRO|nr:hypothetical protein FNF29_02951 [Cafeteria roenbergensis]|eukprot:KAA0153562.1 hypothetical protein FNF29_02951 [Cafeteria roenbergensis]
MAGRARSRSESSNDFSVAQSVENSPFELTAGLLQAKRVKDRAFAKEAYVGAAWILGPGPAAVAAVVLILANEIVFHTSPTKCVRPLDVFVQGIVGLSWLLVLFYANQLVGPCGLLSFFQLQVVYTVWLVVAAVWMILGVVFSAGAEPCLETAPYLYRLAVAETVLLLPLVGIAIIMEVEWCIRKRPFFAAEAKKAKSADGRDQGDGGGGGGGGDGGDSDAGSGGEGKAGSNGSGSGSEDSDDSSDEEEPAAGAK